jgi:hypothetical protein
MAWFKKKTELPPPSKPDWTKGGIGFDKLMPEIPPPPDELARTSFQAQQKPRKSSSLPPTPPRFPSPNKDLSPTPELSRVQTQSQVSMNKLFDNQGQQGSSENNQPPIDELGFELPDFDENEIRALDELKTMASEPVKKPEKRDFSGTEKSEHFSDQKIGFSGSENSGFLKPEVIKAEPKPEPVPQLPPQPELPPGPEQDLNIDFTQDIQELPEEQAEEEQQPEEQQVPEPQGSQDDWATLAKQQPELQPEPEPEPVVQMMPQPRQPIPRVISYPEYQGSSQIPQEKFIEVTSYALVKDELDDVTALIDSADEAALRNATLVKMKTDKDHALVAELNSIQEQLILIDNKLFETPNQFIEVKR